MEAQLMRLQDLRLKEGMSLEQLAELSGVHFRQISISRYLLLVLLPTWTLDKGNTLELVYRSGFTRRGCNRLEGLIVGISVAYVTCEKEEKS